MTSDRELVARSPAGTCRTTLQPGGCGCYGQQLRYGTRALVPGWLRSWGGEPGLPDWAEWPVWQDHGPLSFIAAVDCAALAAVPLDITLPAAGTLLFFYFDGQYDNGQATVEFWEPSTLAGACVLHIGPG